MNFGEIVAPTIKELFIEKIVGMILSGELKPGDALPTERELADEMKISKTVVHEGIQELSRLGFLDVVSRKGVTVADYAQNGNLDTLTAIMQYNGGYLDEKTALSLLDIRFYLECPALENLAANHTDADLETLEKLMLDAQKVQNEDLRTLATALLYFHRTILFLSGNTISPLIVNAFMPAGLTFWEDYIRTTGREVCVERLQTIIDYIRDGRGSEIAAIHKAWLNDYKAQL